jgi:protein-tyrosine sulfotransferase
MGKPRTTKSRASKVKTNCYNPPIFILSCERSGSTLLRYIIDTHQDICSPGELHLGSLCRSLLHLVDNLSHGQVGGSAIQEDRDKLICAEVNHIVSQWMNTYAESRGKRLWCEKTPSNLAYLPTLKKVFPDAKFICLHRNCMDVVHSLFEASKIGIYVEHIYFARNPNQVSVYVDSWTDKTSRLLSFEQEFTLQCIRVRYEDIVTDPAKTLKPVFEFIGVTWDERILDSVFSTPHVEGHGDIKVMFAKNIYQNSIGNGSTISTRDIGGDLLRKMNETLERLGYPVVGQDWDHQPSSPYIKAFLQKPEEQESDVMIATNDIFANFVPQRLKANLQRLQKSDGVCKIIVNGDGVSTWMIDLNIPGGRVETGDRDSDCTIAVTLKDLQEMVKGELNPGEALMTGRVRVSGDIILARELGQILFGADEDGSNGVI